MASMVDNPDELERASREQLVLKARVLGVERPELMTRVELRDEIVRRSEPDPARQKRARGFLGVARDLVASMVEAGLNLPDAAALIRGNAARGDWKGPPPVATVTLAEIYAAQGHLERALGMLDEVLAKEPDHEAARALRQRLATGTDVPKPVSRRQRISFADPPSDDFRADPITEDSVTTAAKSSEALDEEAPMSAIASVEARSDETSGFDVAPAEPFAEAPPSEEALAFDVAPVEPPATAPVAAGAPAEAPQTEERSGFDSAPRESEADEAPVTDVSPPLPVATARVVTLALAGQRQVYWEVPAGSLSALSARAPGGRALVRVVSFRTRGGRVERRAFDLWPDGEVGSAVLTGLTADSVVRAALGWQAQDRFVPFVVASDVRPGNFRAHPAFGTVTPELEQRAVAHLSRVHC